MTARQYKRWLLAISLVVLGLMVVVPPAWQLLREHARDRQVDRWMPTIERLSADRGLDPMLVRSVVRAESSGDPAAVSKKNAIGLMQVTPLTLTDVQRRYDVENGDLTDPTFNLRVGTLYLAHLIDRFDGDLYLALAAYNRGPTHIAKLRRKHPQLTGQQLVEQHVNKVTRKYVKDVLTHAQTPAE